MIVMLNGAFGVGKTTCAQLLQARLPGSLIYDPEEVGFMLRNIVVSGGIEKMDDFQHIKLWPELVVEVAQRLRRVYQCDLIMPMTLAFPEYFRSIKSGLADFEPDLYHFCLTAPAETIRQRLAGRGEKPDGWAFQQLERCLSAFEAQEYHDFIQTEDIGPAEIIESILAGISQAKKQARTS